MALVAIFVASLLGSPHCLGMCGGFVALYASQPLSSWKSHFSYHGARLCAYLLLGAIAGYVGSRIDSFSEVRGLQNLSAILLGVLMVVMGAVMLFQGRVNLHASFLPRSIKQKLVAIQGALLKRARDNPTKLAGTMGALSALLPCGWLYTYVAAAGSTASVFSGTLIMFVFWLGTLPALVTAGSVLTRFGPKVRELIPITTSVLLIVAGFWSLTGHLGLFVKSCCH